MVYSYLLLDSADIQEITENICFTGNLNEARTKATSGYSGPPGAD